MPCERDGVVLIQEHGPVRALAPQADDGWRSCRPDRAGAKERLFRWLLFPQLSRSQQLRVRMDGSEARERTGEGMRELKPP